MRSDFSLKYCTPIFLYPPKNIPVLLHTHTSVFCPFILDVRFVGRTSRGHTGFLIHLPSVVLAIIFISRRTQPFFFLVDREVEFCVLTILIVLHLFGFCFAFFIEEKSQ